MPVSLTVDDVVYQYPVTRDENWGQTATAWAQAITAVASSLRSPSLPVADDGKVRLGNTDEIAWRNAGDTDNITLFVNINDRLILDDGISQKDLSTAGGGNVQMPDPTIDNEIVRWDGINAVVQNSGITISDAQIIDGASEFVFDDGVELTKALVPIGTVIWHDDFDAAIPLPDATYWLPCDGSAATVGGQAVTLKDLSGRYIVGFGTDGGTDIDSAAYATAPVGNAGHQIDIEHSHTVAGHTHSIAPSGNHTHTTASHTHGPGSFATAIDPTTDSNKISFNVGTTDSAWSRDIRHATNGTETPGGTSSVGVPVIGTSAGSGALVTDGQGDHSHGGATGSASPATDDQLSATQSIQPRSIRLRAYIRAV